MTYLSGNTTLGKDEVETLRLQVLERFNKLTGNNLTVEDKHFNSNVKNYERMRLSINSIVEQKLVVPPQEDKEDYIIKSGKPLATLFHTSRQEGVTEETFRTKVVYVLYLYAYGKSREDMAMENPSLIKNNVQKFPYHLIKGHWTMYFDNEGNFAETIEQPPHTAQLRKVGFMIYDNGVVNYWQSNHSKGIGKVLIKENNLVFELKNHFTHLPLFIILHCGQYIPAEVEAIAYGAGGFINVKKDRRVQQGRCVMIHNSYAEEVNLDDETWQKSFLNDLGKPDVYITKENANATLKQDLRYNNMLMRFFSMKDESTLTNNLTIINFTDFRRR